jgi:nucleoside-diphosphate-sugar epimerase
LISTHLARFKRQILLKAEKMPHVLLLGGHGKVALYLTPLLLARAYRVTSVIRNQDHAAEIRGLAPRDDGQLEVLVSSLDNVQSDQDAQKILDAVNPDYVVWAAGK